MSTTPASADYFERNANQWDRLRADYFDESLRDAAIAKAYLRPEDVAADIGGGTGFISAGLASKVALVHLIDASPAMIATAREKLAAFDHVQYHLADGAALPLEDASVDAAFANMYLHHSTDPFAAIQEMVRILKPGGRLVITDLEHHENEWMKEEMADVWLGFEPDEIRSWFKTAGLVNIFIQGSGKTCCAESRDLASTDGASQARIGVFLAVGARPVEGVQAAVQQDYGQHAISGSSCCGSSASSSAGSCCSGSNEQLIFDQGYTPADLHQAPADAAEISLGCGNPLAMALLKEGDTVIDIGSGGGIDAFIAARKVGPAGRVIGVDMTPSMLRRARQSALKAGFRNVQFREGHAEDLPVAGSSADMVISNCVINLAVDKGRVFAEAFRVLKPGGRLEVSDMVTSGPLPARLRQDPQNWAGCVYGALPEQEYLDLVKEAGFKDVRTQRSGSAGALDGTDIYSLQVSAIKPEDTPCCDSGCCCG